jgi:acetyl-CoA synthetase
MEEAAERWGEIRKKFIVGAERKGWTDLNRALLEAPDTFRRPTGEEDTQNTDMMLLYFTSGTTGYPKMVWHDYTYPIAHIVTARYWQNVVSGDDGLHLTVAESGWAKFVWGKLYGQWLCEAGVFAYDFDKFDADDLLKVMGKYKVTTFCAPTIYRFLSAGIVTIDLRRYLRVHRGGALNPRLQSVLRSDGAEINGSLRADEPRFWYSTKTRGARPGSRERFRTRTTSTSWTKTG